MKVSVRKISEVTGFSPATVSNALNHKHGVNAETAEKILKAAREMGYFEDVKINKVKFVLFKKFGSIVEDTPFFPQMITGVEEECRKEGLEMTIVNLDSRSPMYEMQVKELMADQSSAVILLGTEMTEEDENLIRDAKVPMIVVDYWNNEMTFDTILINNLDTACQAVLYLAGRGHRKIGYLKGSIQIKPFISRTAGYRHAMDRAGLEIDPRYEVELMPTMDGAYQDMKKYLETAEELPTAFFADNDMIALGAMKAMWEAGIRIPEDVSVIGFDDLPYSSISNPPLTTMRVPKQRMGNIAVRSLKYHIDEPDLPKYNIQVGTQLVERESVRTLEQ